MLLQAARELALDLRKSYMVGDKVLDVMAGLAAGVKLSILVRTGYGQEQQYHAPEGTKVFDNFPLAADYILGDFLSGKP
jgi:D-glycero-D-manno-heptose 1,7-bisphosphate phosphatase